MTKTWHTLFLVSYASFMLGSPISCKHLPVPNFLFQTWFYASCISPAVLVLKVKFTWAQTSRLTATMGLQVPLSDSGLPLRIVFNDARNYKKTPENSFCQNLTKIVLTLTYYWHH